MVTFVNLQSMMTIHNYFNNNNNICIFLSPISRVDLYENTSSVDLSINQIFTMNVHVHKLHDYGLHISNTMQSR